VTLCCSYGTYETLGFLDCGVMKHPWPNVAETRAAKESRFKFQCGVDPGWAAAMFSPCWSVVVLAAAAVGVNRESMETGSDPA
jgi:hypothetical protein